VVIQDAYVRFRNTFTEELFIQTEMDDEFGEAGTPWNVRVTWLGWRSKRRVLSLESTQVV